MLIIHEQVGGGGGGGGLSGTGLSNYNFTVTFTQMKWELVSRVIENRKRFFEPVTFNPLAMESSCLRVSHRGLMSGRAGTSTG